MCKSQWYLLMFFAGPKKSSKKHRVLSFLLSVIDDGEDFLFDLRRLKPKPTSLEEAKNVTAVFAQHPVSMVRGNWIGFSCWKKATPPRSVTVWRNLDALMGTNHGQNHGKSFHGQIWPTIPKRYIYIYLYTVDILRSIFRCFSESWVCVFFSNIGQQTNIINSVAQFMEWHSCNHKGKALSQQMSWKSRARPSTTESLGWKQIKSVEQGTTISCKTALVLTLNHCQTIE